MILRRTMTKKEENEEDHDWCWRGNFSEGEKARQLNETILITYFAQNKNSNKAHVETGKQKWPIEAAVVHLK